MGVAALLAFITSMPQLYLCYVRGAEWTGSCAYLDPDELVYAAYTNALTDGRPRRNDPYTGKDGGQFETYFSIQFLPGYAVALTSRILNISVNTAFIFLLPLATFGACLVVWRILVDVTQDAELAVAAAIGVIWLGTAAAHNPLHILWGPEVGYDLFPFLRRYIPALPFPLFLASSLFVWRALTRNTAWAVLAGLSFAALVYSYYYLWTTAASWFGVITLFWFIARPQERQKVWRVFGILVAIGGSALVPYAWLLMHRVQTIDKAQSMEITHAPDLLRAPELYGMLLIGVLAYCVRKRKASWRDPKILLIASFAIAPFLTFNQQVLTGHSLQPFHYEEFVTNYYVVLAGFLMLAIVSNQVPRRVLHYLAIAGLFISFTLGIQAARKTAAMNIHLDEARAVALRLGQESPQGTVFASDVLLTHLLPTSSRNPVLWARYLYAFSNVDSMGQKRRFYQYLYYSGFDEARLAQALQADFTARWELFGAERANPVLARSAQSVTEEDIKNTAREYGAFVASFDSGVAGDPLLSYAVVSTNDDLSNLDRWYERGPVERINDFLVYRLQLKTR